MEAAGDRTRDRLTADDFRDEPGYLPTLLGAVLDPYEYRGLGDLPVDFGTPWADGGFVFASDGCLAAACPASSLKPEVLARVPRWSLKRPSLLWLPHVGLHRSLWEAKPAPPYTGRAVRRPVCRECHGRPGYAPCKNCNGVGWFARSGTAVSVGGAAGPLLDVVYASLLADHRARLFPPALRGYRGWSVPFWFGTSSAFGVVSTYDQHNRGESVLWH